MNTSNEHEAVRIVAAKLANRFPSVLRSEVDRIVLEEHRRLDGAPVRAYVAVLVEHASRNRLAHPELEVLRQTQELLAS